MMMFQSIEGREGRKEVNSERQVQIDFSRFYTVVGEGTWTRKKERKKNKSVQFSSVQALSHVQLFVTSWIAARQASLSITNSRSLLKLMSIVSVMPSSHLILCRPLLLLPSIPPRIRVFSNELTLHMRWPKYWSFSFNIRPSSEHPGLISFRTDWLDLIAVQGINTKKQKVIIEMPSLSIRCGSFSLIQKREGN